MVMNMETIQVNVPSELAQRLRPYQDEMPRILEYGLRYVEGKAEASPAKKAELEAIAIRQIIAVLRQAGAVGPDPEVTAQYLAKRANRSWQPIVAGGKPASEMIVEERDSYLWASARE
jgi:hypothetical protein